jgi:hypothetical protein
MGYSTQYIGELKFKKELVASELAYLKQFLGKDVRDHEDWPQVDNYYISLEFTDNYDGLKWDYSEKVYGMDEIINFIIDQMCLKFSDFELEGEFNCQGEDIDDRYQIVIKENRAVKIETPPIGTKIECPHCEREFYLE